MAKLLILYVYYRRIEVFIVKFELEIVRFDVADIITTSGCPGNPNLPPALGGNKAVSCGDQVV